MPSAHAKLGPSGASRWLTCPGSIRLSEKLPPQPDSPYAAEGTLAHTLGEIKASRAFGLLDAGGFADAMQEFSNSFHALYGEDDYRYDEMQAHTDAYVDLLRDRMQLYPMSTLLLEQRLETGVDRCWGTSDAVIVSPQHVEIVDFKYGAGVPVDATENPQLMLYGVGALDAFGDMLGETEVVRMTVHQPRLDSTSVYEMAPVDLRAWRDNVVAPTAALALTDDAPVVPDDKACRWCPAAGWCKARMEKATQEDFGQDPDLISPDELGDVLARLPEIKAWCNAVENTALDRAYSQGEEIPGWKVVRSGGKRYITDPPAAIQLLIDKGFPAERVADFKVKGIGELEKLVGKKDLPGLLGELVGKSQGKPSLVPEADKRAAIDPSAEAVKDFA